MLATGLGGKVGMNKAAAAVGHEGGADRMGSHDGPANGNGRGCGAGPPGGDSCSSRPEEIVNSGRAGRAGGSGDTGQETMTTTTKKKKKRAKQLSLAAHQRIKKPS